MKYRHTRYSIKSGVKKDPVTQIMQIRRIGADYQSIIELAW